MIWRFDVIRIYIVCDEVENAMGVEITNRIFTYLLHHSEPSRTTRSVRSRKFISAPSEIRHRT